MEIFLGIIIGLASILFLITLHELAHFILAKLAGAYVYEFSIGMGPKIYQWGKKETRYTIRLLPLGGYVSIASEIVDAPSGRENEIVAEERYMENLQRGKKAAFISAGAFMNLFLAFLLLISAYAIYPHKQDLNLAPISLNYGPLNDAITNFNNTYPNKISSDAKIVHIKNEKWTNPSDSDKDIHSYYELNDWIKIYNKKSSNDENPVVDITFATSQVVTLNPSESNNYFLGVTAASYQLTSSQVVSYGFIDTFKNSYSMLQAFGQLFTFHWQNISGPVGIIKSTSGFLDPHLSGIQKFSTFLRWVSLLSANLFLLNMLPLPPLDGYKFMENGVEAITRKKLNAKLKTIVTIVGAVLFIALFVAITIKDILF